MRFNVAAAAVMAFMAQAVSAQVVVVAAPATNVTIVSNTNVTIASDTFITVLTAVYIDICLDCPGGLTTITASKTTTIPNCDSNCVKATSPVIPMVTTTAVCNVCGTNNSPSTITITVPATAVAVATVATTFTTAKTTVPATQPTLAVYTGAAAHQNALIGSTSGLLTLVLAGLAFF